MLAKVFIRVVVILISNFSPVLLQAQESASQRYSDVNFALLPPYCHAKFKGDENEQKMWAQRMGGDHFIHIHHYCFGLIKFNKANMTFDKNQRRDLLQSALKEFDIIYAFPPNSPLRPQGEQYKAQIQVMLNMLK